MRSVITHFWVVLICDTISNQCGDTNVVFSVVIISLFKLLLAIESMQIFHDCFFHINSFTDEDIYCYEPYIKQLCWARVVCLERG